ncbi:uncharacterized protein RHIMIDRAFT_304993 [Rhizopus microsporus ATCC 52813]|uniref:Uncharacterized protein n=1 Tax=Rhizopus microsporus ATCC 52813 TaxID=1340429 RepID=A0A2G4SZJ1_RHIZD|nr:uncharacterized protein RHIMIDRAFT_304993 [Rhizopus microsporus ATCC 52813]PHZ14171.1 hypothetical protein RHIMIDRAFT_304993 [Rhizopus microsporus ATCC 52813]
MDIPSASSMDQRLFEELDHFLRATIPCPSMEHDTAHLAAVDPATPTVDTHHAQLAFRSVVFTGSSIGAPTPSGPPSRESGKRHRSASPQEEPQLEYASVEHLAKCLKHSSLSSSTLAIISPTASSTRPQYHFRQQNYATMCSARQLNYHDPFPQQIINYLAGLHTTHSLKLSTLATYSNSILALFSVKDQQAIKHSEPYMAFFKALKAKTILPLRHWSYDVAPAISYIVSLGPTNDLSDDLLTAETA